MSRPVLRPKSPQAEVAALPKWRTRLVQRRSSPARGILVAVLISAVFWTGCLWIAGVAIG